MFKLESPCFETLTNPSPEEISEALSQLPGGNDSFMILSASDLTMVQCAGPDDGRFHIMYAEGATHYACDPPWISAEQTLECLVRFADADPDWNRNVRWMEEHLGVGVYPYHTLGPDAGKPTDLRIEAVDPPPIERTDQNLSVDSTFLIRVIGWGMIAAAIASILIRGLPGGDWIAVPLIVVGLLVLWAADH